MNKKRHHIGGAMVRVLTSTTVDRILGPRSVRNKKLENWNLLVIDAMIDKNNLQCQ